MVPQQVAYALLPIDTARITQQGIKYKSRYYTCPTFLEEGWGSKAAVDATWKVTIKHDPRMTGKILLCREDGSYEECRRTEPWCANWLEEDFSFQEDLQRAQLAVGLEHNIQRDLDFKREIDKIVAKATLEKEQQKKQTLSQTKRIKGTHVRENRKIEASMQRQEEQFLKEKTWQSKLSEK